VEKSFDQYLKPTFVFHLGRQGYNLNRAFFASSAEPKQFIMN